MWGANIRRLRYLVESYEKAVEAKSEQLFGILPKTDDFVGSDRHRRDCKKTLGVLQCNRALVVPLDDRLGVSLPR